jgi:stage III sporulation protein AA
MDKRLSVLPGLFPEPWRPSVLELLERRGQEIEELRLRVGSPVSWVTKGRELWLNDRDLPPVDAGLLEEIVKRASGHAVYAVQEQLRQGYLTLPGGHRLGVCGKAGVEKGSLMTIRSYQALNLRLASERPGCADSVSSFLWAYPASTLILGPPGAGKTTLLRDMTRQLSDRFRQRVGLVDERGELAACEDAVPQLSVGRRTDVLTGCPKAVGVEILVRTMSPQWIVVDEITSEKDVEAMIRASYCGVRFLATAHAADIGDLDRRPLYRALGQTEIFENFAMIRSDRSVQCERRKYGAAEACGSRDDPDDLRVGGHPRGSVPAPDL